MKKYFFYKVKSEVGKNQSEAIPTWTWTWYFCPYHNQAPTDVVNLMKNRQEK